MSLHGHLLQDYSPMSMMMERKLVWLAILLIFTSCVNAPYQKDDPEVALQRLLIAMKKMDTEAFRKEFDPQVLATLPKDTISNQLRSLDSTFGKPLKLHKSLSASTGSEYFIQFERGIADIDYSWGKTGMLTGIYFKTRQKSIPVPKRTKSKMIIPLAGDVSILMGGGSVSSNPNYESPIERFALELGVTGENGKIARKSSAKSNQDFYCFGKNVLAPADGVVVEAIDGVRDNVPGEVDPFMALGNAILIRHGAYEVSVLSNLKQGSVQVKPGQTVTQGEVVAECGNSGNSSEPHLHFHVQNTDFIPNASGIKIFFDHLNKKIKGRTDIVRDYSPIRGDVFLQTL